MVFILLAGLYVNEWIFAALFFIIAMLGLKEFYTIVSKDNAEPQQLFGLIAGAVLYIGIAWMQYLPGSFPLSAFPYLPFILPVPIFFLPFVFEIYRKKAAPLTNISLTILGVFYIVLPLSLLNVMNAESAVHFSGFPAFLTAFFILIWFNDTGAYLFGKQFGKHKLFERISPKKTWEGTLAGLVTAMVTAILFSLLVKEIPLVDWLMLAVLVVFFGIMGDLAESMFKRSLDIKDSGTILPGHGGILDRFDAIFISAPFVFLYFLFRFI
jgi:phosphatidate cytidylyltransferase